jgi:hypothetical protein
LKLNGNEAIGDCPKALGSAVCVMKQAKSFEEGMTAVVREAGDADPHGAVVAAKFGFSEIDRKFIEV